jgi:antitoxin ParD1/3/4
MPTRNIVLTERQHELVDSLVHSGRYQNASEVLREGLRLIEAREQVESAKLRALKEAAKVGWADVAAGRFTDIDATRIDDWIAQIGREAAAALPADAPARP